LEQPLQGGPVDVGPGETAIIVEFGQGDPPFVPLTLNKGLACFALRVERVKLVIQASSVDLRV